MSQAVSMKSLNAATATGAGAALKVAHGRTRHAMQVTLGGTVAATAGTIVLFQISTDGGTTWTTFGPSWGQDDPHVSGDTIVYEVPATDVRANLNNLGSGGTAPAVTAVITSDNG